MALPWRDEDVATLRRLWGLGETSKMIAGVLGITRNAVIGKVNRLGLVQHGTKPKPPPRTRREKYERRLPVKRMARVLPQSQLKGVTLLELKEHHCREVLGIDAGIPMYCGQDALKGSSWCDAHFKANTRPAPERRYR